MIQPDGSESRPDGREEQPPRLVTRLWRITLFSVSFLLVLEIATRIDQAVSYGAPLIGAFTYESALFDYDELGKKGRAYGRYEKWTLNSRGMRGPEITVEPTAGVWRIATLGASETFGLFESVGMEWPRQMEVELRAGGLKAEVVNAALVGMTFRRRVEYFENRVLPLTPDVVLMILEYPSYVNLSRRVDQGLSPVAPEAPRKPRQRLRFGRKLKDALLPRLPEPVGAWVQARLTDVRILRHRISLKEDFGSVREVTEGELEPFKSDVRRFIELAKQNQVEVILLAPALRIEEATLRGFESNFPYIRPEWLVEAQMRFLDAAAVIADEAGVPLVDLDKVVESREAEVMPDVFHFSDDGAYAVAHAAADSVRARFTSVVVPANPGRK